MHTDKLIQDIEHFKAQPENCEFKSFDEPGEYFSNQELEYKREFAVHFQEIGKRLIERQYDGYFEDLINLLSKKKLGSHQTVQNLISFYDWGKLKNVVEQSVENQRNFANHLRQLLEAADNDKQLWMRLDEFISWLGEVGLGVAGLTKLWPTFFLFLWRPEKFIFIKPDFFDEMLESYGLEKLGKGKPLDSNKYRRVMQDMARIKKTLQCFGETDYIGVQSFLWHVLKTLDSGEADTFSNVWLIQSAPEGLLNKRRAEQSGELTSTDDQIGSFGKYSKCIRKGDLFIFVDPINRNIVLGEVRLLTVEFQDSSLKFSTEKLWSYKKIVSTTLNEQFITPGFVSNTDIREDSGSSFCQEYLDLGRWNFLCDWNPEKYRPIAQSTVDKTPRDGNMNYSAGDRARLRWTSKNGTVGDPIYVLRTASDPRGIIAKARICDVRHKGQYVGIEFEDVRADGSDTFLTQIQLEARLPEHQWSPGKTLKGDQQELRSSLRLLWRNVPRVPRNSIYYGPPGTGKTFILRNKCLTEYTGSTKTVSREEHLRKTLVEMKWREVIAASLLEMKSPQTVPNIKGHEYVQIKVRLSEQNPRQVGQRVTGVLQMHTPVDCKTVKTKLESRQDPGWFWKNDDKTWRLVDDFDSGETGLADYLSVLRDSADEASEYFKRYDFVTFHQSYSYEEFVEGIRPTLNRDSEEMAFELHRGIFREICEKARKDPSGAPYAIFIDEINRGNISKIFGELITLIEEDKREGTSNELEVTLPYSKDCFKVPRNLDIYGSMNTADRSLVPIDNALRRRFTFYELTPQPTLLSTITYKTVAIDLKRLLEVMNERIEVLFDREHMIGHAYFLTGKGESIRGIELPDIFRYKIIPLLTEYFFDDWIKVREVLADDISEKDLQFVHEHSIITSSNKKTYRLNQAALENPEAYVKIYQ